MSPFLRLLIEESYELEFDLSDLDQVNIEMLSFSDDQSEEVWERETQPPYSTLP